MKKDRAKLRGKPLDEDCKRANRATNEYGPDDNRVFCFGLIDLRYDEPLDKCTECGAFVDNAEPPEKVIVYQESTQSYTSEVAE